MGDLLDEMVAERTRKNPRFPALLAKAKKELDFDSACKAAGITRKGRKLARVVWNVADSIFDAVDTDVDPFEVVDVAVRLLKCKAADRQQRQRR